MPRLLFVKSRKASFIELDQQLLAERYDVHEIYQPGHFSDPRIVLREVWAADVVVGWWASWHTFLPFMLAWLLGKPSLLIVGGFDTAAEPEFNYGYQLGGLRARMSRLIMRSAKIVMTNSEYSREEIHRNIGPLAVRLVYHGIPDDYADADAGSAPAGAARRATAITVGVVDRTNLDRKGLRAFVQAAAEVPEVDFVLAGKTVGDAAAELERIAVPNVRLTGWLEQDELETLLRRARVYVQASRHEGFGVSVAEAMLARCVPVVTRAGALPEVVGDAGIVLDEGDPRAVAIGVREALHLELGDAARSRVLEHFSVQKRRDGLFALLDEL